MSRRLASTVAALRLFRGFAALSLIASASALSAATLTVTNTNDNLAGSLRQAIQDANPGDTIVFNIPTNDPQHNASTQTWSISLVSGPLTIAKSLNIDAGMQRIVLQWAGQQTASNGQILVITSGTIVISNLTISNGRNVAVRNAGNLTFSGCTLTANQAETAAVLSNTGTATLVNCTVANNQTGTLSGVVVNAGGVMTVRSCTFAFNQGGTGTGTRCFGIVNNSAGSGVVHIGNSVVANDVTSADSGDLFGSFISDGYNFIGSTTGSTGFCNDGSRDQCGSGTTPADPKLVATLSYNGGPTKTLQPQNDSPLLDRGASIEPVDQRAFRRPVDHPLIQNAPGGNGSDIGAVEFDITQTGPNFTVTTSDEHSDGLCGIGDCSLWDAANAANGNADASVITFASGVVGTITTKLQANGIQLTSPVTITGPGARLLAISGDAFSRVFQIGSGVAVTMSGLTISNGATASDGAGIFNGGQLTVSDCAFFNNRATGASSFGGAISSQTAQSLTVTNCTFLLNQAGARGGAVANAAGNVTATNSTFNQNSAAIGGAVYSATGSASNSATLRNCTIIGNSATTTNAGTGGGGIFEATSSGFHLANTIVAGNSSASSGPDVFGSFQSDGNNLIGNPTGSTGFGAAGDQVGSGAIPLDPKAGPVADNGGNTNTMALLPGSPAIDGGNDANAPSLDQRGFARFGRSDIGAFEVQPPPPTPTPTPTPTPVTTLANISTRLRVETDDNVLIGGFIITGTQPKKVIVRGIGNSLPLPDKLADPTLELHGPNGLIEANNNWIDSPNKQAIIDSTIAPSSDLESAIVVTLPANGTGYTAIVRGLNGGTGIGVVEAYDLNTAVDSRLANISTRGFVQTGDNVLIAGTIVVGQASQKVIVRAIGPSLPIAGKLENPTLELHDQNGGLLQENDNWVDSPNKQAIIDSTVAPTNDLESAIVATLPASGASYTAIVRGVNNTTGIAVVEVYALN